MRSTRFRTAVQRTGRHATAPVLLQTTVPAYRDGFLSELLRRIPELRVVAGPDYFDGTSTISTQAQAVCERTTNRFLLGRRLLWQSGVVWSCRQASCVVLEMNPRILSSWLLLLMRRALARPTVVWGHAWPRGGRNSSTVFLRRVMLRLATRALAYTATDRRDLAKSGKPVYLAANAVNRRADTVLLPGRAADVLQIGRLVEGKKPELALRAFARASAALPPETSLVFVGSGPEEAGLCDLARDLGVDDRVGLLGSLWDTRELQRVFADSLVSLSPGYAGLNVTQSLTHGVPVMVAENEPHAPEVDLCDDTNSRWFPSDDIQGLADALVVAFEERRSWLDRREAISAAALRVYSTEAMVDGFISALDGSATQADPDS